MAEHKRRHLSLLSSCFALSACVLMYWEYRRFPQGGNKFTPVMFPVLISSDWQKGNVVLSDDVSKQLIVIITDERGNAGVEVISKSSVWRIRLDLGDGLYFNVPAAKNELEINCHNHDARISITDVEFSQLKAVLAHNGKDIPSVAARLRSQDLGIKTQQLTDALSR